MYLLFAAMQHFSFFMKYFYNSFCLFVTFNNFCICFYTLSLSLSLFLFIPVEYRSWIMFKSPPLGHPYKTSRNFFTKLILFLKHLLHQMFLISHKCLKADNKVQREMLDKLELKFSFFLNMEKSSSLFTLP